MGNTTSRIQHLLLKVAGLKPTVPNPTTLTPNQAGWKPTDIMEGEWCYNNVDNIWYYRKDADIESVEISTSFNFIDFVEQTSNPAELAYRMFASQAAKALSFYTHIPGLPPQRVNREQIARVYNNSGALIPKGSVVYISDINLTEGVGEIELAKSDSRFQAERTLGVMLHDIANLTDGIAGRFTFLVNTDTSAFNAQDILYLSPTVPGGITNVLPDAPNYPVKIGVASYIHATNGVIGIEVNSFNGNDTQVNIDGALNGIVTQTAKVEFSVVGGIIYADVSNEFFPTKNLPFIIDGDTQFLNTTTNTGPDGKARVVVPPGIVGALQSSFLHIYIDNGTPTLACTAAFPFVPNARLGNIAAGTAASTDTYGIASWRRYNNAVNSLSEGVDGSFGIFTYMLDAMRIKLGTSWFSGMDGTPTVDNTQIRLALTAGIATQVHQQNTPAFDGLQYFIYNDETNAIVYEPSSNLTDIIQDASGGTLLANNTYYRLLIHVQANSGGAPDRVLATRPLGSYTLAANALTDASNYDVGVNDPSTEGLTFITYAMVIGRTGGSGGTINLIELQDKRSRTQSGAGGGAGGGAGSNDKLRISAGDTTEGYGEDKFVAGDGVVIEKLNTGDNEQLQISTPQLSIKVADTGIVLKSGFQYSADSADGTFNALLPPTPGGTSRLRLYFDSSADNDITINGNGANIEGAATWVAGIVQHQHLYEFIYNTNDGEWKVRQLDDVDYENIFIKDIGDFWGTFRPFAWKIKIGSKVDTGGTATITTSSDAPYVLGGTVSANDYLKVVGDTELMRTSFIIEPAT